MYFLNSDGNVDVYDYSTATYKSEIKLDLKFRQEPEVDSTGEEDKYYVLEYYNNSHLIYTGIAGAEFGVLNYLEKQVELYNAKTGKLSKILKLPEDMQVYGSLNFAYTNGIYWFFDKDERTWLGYK